MQSQRACPHPSIVPATARKLGLIGRTPLNAKHPLPPMHSSIYTLWHAYLRSIGETPGQTEKTFAAWSFGDTGALADELLALVLAGTKRATTPSVWELEARGEPMPRPGDLHVILDGGGVARCMIQTTQVEVKPFSRVGADYARLEGEGDGTLAYWRRTHWTYYERVLAGTDYAPQPDMPVVCEQFEVVLTAEETAAR